MDANDPLNALDDVWSSEYVDRLRLLLGEVALDQLCVFALPSDFCVSVVVPVYNESGTIQGMVDRLVETGLPLEILFVDDGSQDDTADQLASLVTDLAALDHERSADVSGPLGEMADGSCVGRRRPLKASLLKHESNRGKGAAIRTGVRHSTGQIVVIQDADLEYDPRDLRKLIRPIVEGEADVAYGSRYAGSDRLISPWWHQAINGLITSMNCVVTGPRLTDVETCYKMARGDLFREVAAECRENRFGIEIELTARFARRNVRFAEKPIRYRHRWYAEGKKIGWQDGISAIRCMCVYGLLRR